MSEAQDWKTIGLQVLQFHEAECGDGSCGCGCGEHGLPTMRRPATAATSQERGEPAP